MKGGYQILDLTGATAGSSVTITGIFDTIKGNNEKVILIKANDGQRVFAQAKEVDGDYVITYLSAEGKTVKVVINDKDSITTTIADDSATIEGLTEAVNEINSRVSANTFDTMITIDPTQYTDVDHLRSINSDGYLRISADANSSLNVNVAVDGTGTILAQVTNGAMETIYVKKDTEIYFTGTGTVKLITFED